MERFIEVPGGRLFVADDGDGPALLLIHAGICDSRAWDPMVPGLAAAGYRVIRYDARGFGRSETEDVAFSNRADVAAILDALGVERAALVGNSRGGVIAFDTAIERPDRVVAVVGIGAGLGGFEGEPTPEERAMFEELERHEEAADPDVDAIVDFDIRLWVAGPHQPVERVDPALVALVRDMDRLANDRTRPRGRPIPLQPVANGRLAELRCPVLAIAGGLDVSDVAQTARHLETEVPGARAVILPGVAHLIGMEAPGVVNELIVDFLRPLGSWS